MDQTILITGATSGFGKACAELFAARGWKLIDTGRRSDRLTELLDQFPETPIHCASFDVRDRMIDTNIKGLCYMTRMVLPGMVRREKGHIINIGSVASNWPYPGGNAYGATKAFGKQFSNNLRADLLGTGIRVTNIEPGLAETEFSVVRFNGDTAKAADVYQGTEPLTAKDIAEIVFWVTSVPQYVNINAVDVMPVCQSWSPFAISRTTGTD